MQHCKRICYNLAPSIMFGKNCGQFEDSNNFYEFAMDF